MIALLLKDYFLLILFKGHLIEGRLYDDEEGKLAGTFTMEMEKEEDFKKILKNLKTIPSVNTIAEIK